MKYGIIPTSLAERVALAAKKVPLVLIDVLIPLIQTRTLMNLVRLSVFEQLKDGPQSAAELAAKLSVDAECLEMAMSVARSGGYLRFEHGRFALTEQSRRMLLSGSPQDSRSTVLFAFHEWDMIEKIDELLLSGKGLDFHGGLQDELIWQHYQGSMLELARGMAPIVAGMIPLQKDASLMLDIAGSHGLMGAAICRRHPGLKSIVLDLPAALPHARELAEQSGIADVVEHRAADMLTDDYPAGADLALFSNILHHFTPQQNIAMLKKARQALKQGGTLALWDVERRPADAPPELAGDAMSLFFRLTSSSGTFTAADYAGWLRDAGFKQIRARRSPYLPGMVLHVGTA